MSEHADITIDYPGGRRFRGLLDPFRDIAHTEVLSDTTDINLSITRLLLIRNACLTTIETREKLSISVEVIRLTQISHYGLELNRVKVQVEEQVSGS